MKPVLTVILGLFMAFLLVQNYLFWRRGREAETKFGELQAELKTTKEDFNNLRAEYEYFLNPENLEKELRARFNYKSGGETLMILVPKTASSSR